MASTKPSTGSWLMGALRASGDALASATSGTAKRLSEAASNFSARGSTTRALPIDESSRDWKRRSGRSSGGDTYEHGDLCRTVFQRALSLSPREREVLYCGAVLLVGVLEAEGLGGAGGHSPDAYVSISLEDAEGGDIRAEHALTRTVGPAGGTWHWDEVMAVGQKIPSFDDVKKVRVSAKGFSRGLLGVGSAEKLGVARLGLEELMQEADAGEAEARGAWVEKWLTLGEAVRLKLCLLFHRPPSLPQPTSLGLLATAGHSLGLPEAATPGHFYITLCAVNRLGERVRDGEGERMARLRGATTRDSDQPSFCDLFELHDLEAGGAPEDISLHGRYGAWGWPGGRPKALATAPPSKASSCGLRDATALQLCVYDTGLVNGQLVGELTIPLASLWGHEDTVAHDSMLRCARWWKLEPPPSRQAKLWSGPGRRAHIPRVFLDIVARFDAPLLPPGWSEAVSAEVGEVYFYQDALGAAQWTPPAWQEASFDAVWEKEGSSSSSSSAGSAGSSSASSSAAEAAAAFAATASASHPSAPAHAASYTSVLLRETGRGRSESEKWAKASPQVEGACKSITKDLLPGDAPHKPPRPRCAPDGSLPPAAAAATVAAAGSGAVMAAAAAAAAAAGSAGLAGVAAAGMGGRAGSMEGGDIGLGLAPPPSLATEPFFLASPMALNKSHREGGGGGGRGRGQPQPLPMPAAPPAAPPAAVFPA